MILILDNFDSFVFNLARYFQRLGQTTHVVRNDAIDVSGMRRLAPAALVLSPGPCGPSDAGISVAAVQELHNELPILGVCLGHQVIAAALGGRVVRSQSPMHGQSSEITHDGTGIFRGLPRQISVGRYHSLAAEIASLPACLHANAHTADGLIMAVQHRTRPIVGVQFHPESVLTEQGFSLLANFLTIAGLSSPGILPDWNSEVASPGYTEFIPPQRPITF